jgi:hypothetical protein
MYRLTTEDMRNYRNMDYGTMYNIVHRCNHRYFEKVTVKNDDDYFICKKCKISWFVYQKHPMRGNLALEKYLYSCTHEHVRSVEGSTTHNQCLECDAIIEKTSVGKVWKNMRNLTETITNRITRNGKENDIDRMCRYVWDPEKYGDKKWGIEYD